MKHIRLSRYQLCIFLILALVFPLFAPFFPTHAANLEQAFVRTDRMIASTASGGTVCARWTTTAGTDSFIEVTFPTGYTVNATPGNWTVTTTNLPVIAGVQATAMPGIAVPGVGGVSGQIVRWTITDIASAAITYCFNFASASTLTIGTAGTDKQASIRTYTGGTVAVGSGTLLDQSNIALAAIANDQVVINATVPPTFNFALGTNVQNLGTLSTSTVISGSGVTVSLGTNAANGWLTWVRSTNAALNSAATGDSIATSGSLDNTPTTLSTGANGYVLDCDLTTDGAGTGTITIAAEYNGTSTSMGGTLSTNFQEVAASSGTTAGDVVTLIPRVTISALTRASTDYTDTLTVVGAANF